jgi:hypothetical protein
MTQISIGPHQKFNVGDSSSNSGNKNAIQIHFPIAEQAEQKRVNFQVIQFSFI